MRCAVVDTDSNRVVDVIEADPSGDVPPEGTQLRRIGTSGLAGPGIGVGFIYSSAGYSMTVTAEEVDAAIAAEDAPPDA